MISDSLVHFRAKLLCLVSLRGKSVNSKSIINLVLVSDFCLQLHCSRTGQKLKLTSTCKLLCSVCL